MKKVTMAALPFAFSLAVTMAGAEGEPPSPPKEDFRISLEGNQFLIKSGEIPLAHMLALLSDAASLPLILGDSSLNPQGEKVVVREAFRLKLKSSPPPKDPGKEEQVVLEAPNPQLAVEDPGPLFLALRENRIDVQRVVLQSGREILEATRIPLVRGKPLPPVVIRATSPARKDQPALYLSEGWIPVGNLLQALADFTGEDLVYRGAPGYELKIRKEPSGVPADLEDGEPAIYSPAEFHGVNEEVLRELLEGAGFRIRRVSAEAGKRQILVSPRTAPPARFTPLKQR